MANIIQVREALTPGFYPYATVFDSVNLAVSDDPTTVYLTEDAPSGSSGYSYDGSAHQVRVFARFQNAPINSGSVAAVVCGVLCDGLVSTAGSDLNAHSEYTLMDTDWNPATVTWNAQPAASGLLISRDASSPTLVTETLGATRFWQLGHWVVFWLQPGVEYYGIAATITGTSADPAWSVADAVGLGYVIGG